MILVFQSFKVAHLNGENDMGRYYDDREPVGQTCPIIDEAKDCVSLLYDITSSYDDKFQECDINVIDFNLRRIKTILEELRSANSSLRDWGNNWVDKANEFEREIDTLKDDIDDYESGIDLLKDNINSLEDDIKDYKSKIDSLEDDIKDYMYKINTLEEDIYHLKN